MACKVIVKHNLLLKKPQDIERLFEAPDCPPCVRCEFAGNENWYVTFLTEDDAHRAYNHLRENVQSFLGKPIMVSSHGHSSIFSLLKQFML